MNMFKFSPESPPSVLQHQDSGFGISYSSSSQSSHQGFVDSLSVGSYNRYNRASNQRASCLECSELRPGAGDSSEAPDFSDACIKYLSDILMEEDLDCKPATIHDYEALQATEKLLYDAIGETYLPPSDQVPSLFSQNAEFPGGDVNTGGSSHGVNAHIASESTMNPNWAVSPLKPFLVAGTPADSSVQSCSPSSVLTGGAIDTEVRLTESSLGGLLDPEFEKGKFKWIEKAVADFIDMGNPDFNGLINQESGQKIHEAPVRPDERGNSALNESRSKKKHPRDDGDSLDTRNNKHIEAYSEEDLMGQFDDILLRCRGGADDISVCTQDSSQSDDANGRSQRSQKSGGSRSRSSRSKKQSTSIEDIVDLNALLTQCAQAVASFDLRNACELLKRIRQHSSPRGDGIQRVAHYFADALEARLAGTASQQYRGIVNLPISASQFMKAYRTFVKVIPFKRMSFFLANKTIAKLSAEASRIHIIDFGILFGIQWPCFIQHLSQRENGPPMLQMTAVDFPQNGYQPAARVEESVRRLAAYCQRFGVPFESHSIAKSWETLQPKDFNIDKDELLVVNCLYRSRTLLDDTVEVDSPRDAFLKLIRNLNPDLFIHGILNGTHNAPFFTTRFREAMFYYSSMFDLMEATIPREDQDRQLIEREFYGKDILNVVASEGAERVERPETYKQWQVRNQRAGFRQVPLDRELVSTAKAVVKAHYHKDFVVDEDNNWMLQGWKGRLLFAISCWKPA